MSTDSVRRIVAYDRPLFDLEAAPRSGSTAGAFNASTGAHGFDSIMLRSDTGVDLFVGSARTVQQRAVVGLGCCTLVSGVGTHRARFVAHDRSTYGQHSRFWCNQVLWLLLHSCASAAVTPERTSAFEVEYTAINRGFADVIVEELRRRREPSHVMWQDYQLWLAPAMVRALIRGDPDLSARVRMSHYNHIPFPPPEEFAQLPKPVCEALLTGLLGNDAVVFQTSGHAQHFRDACVRTLGLECDGAGVRAPDGHTVSVSAHPFPVDRQRLDRWCADPGAVRAQSKLRELAAGRQIVFVTGRIDPAKDLLGTVAAFANYLDDAADPASALLLMQVQRSRLHTAEWARLAADLEHRVAAVNARFAHLPRPPIDLGLDDDMARAVAGFRLYDILDVVPGADGLNLVSLEGPLVNEHDGTLILSETAGAAAYLGPAAWLVPPRDVAAHSSALRAALEAPADARATRSRMLRSLVPAGGAREWMSHQARAAWR